MSASDVDALAARLAMLRTQVAEAQKLAASADGGIKALVHRQASLNGALLAILHVFEEIDVTIAGLRAEKGHGGA